MDVENRVETPVPTAWPIVLALGLTLIAAGLVTAASVSALGAVLTVAGAAGWFRQVLPVESHEWTPVVQEEIAIRTSRERVERVMGAAPRACVPVEIYPISAGIRGGVAGGAVMAVLAAIYGIASGNGTWYAMNLLVGGLFPAMATETAAQIGSFHISRLIVGVPIHLLISLLVGLLYGAMLPMLPRRPILLGGIVTPLLWSGLIYGVLACINPVMNQHIRWAWFVASQVGFGVVAGMVVSVHERILTPQNLPLVMRMGIEAPGIMAEHQGDVRR